MRNENSFSPTSLPSAPAIFVEAFSLVRERWQVFLGIGLILVIARAFTLLLEEIFEVNLFISILSLIILAVVNSLWYLALLYAVKDSETGIGIVEAYKASFKKILSFWWLSFLSFLIILGGLLLLIIPGIIFAVWFSLAVYVLVAEDIGGLKALSKSREYVRGHFLSVLWRLVFVHLVAFILVFPTFVIGTTGMGAKIFLILFSWIYTPIEAAYLFFIYNHLKRIKGEAVLTSASNEAT